MKFRAPRTLSNSLRLPSKYHEALSSGDPCHCMTELSVLSLSVTVAAGACFEREELIGVDYGAEPATRSAVDSDLPKRWSRNRVRGRGIRSDDAGICPQKTIDSQEHTKTQ